MQKGTLLVVDDESDLVDVVKLTVENHADEVLSAYNGVEALEVLEKNTVHCILCDIKMPKMDGIEFIKKLRKSGNKVPLVFFTGHGSRDLMVEAAKYGAFDFLNKPELEGLEDVVKNGLLEGIGKEKSALPQEDALMNEYQKLVKQFQGLYKL